MGTLPFAPVHAVAADVAILAVHAFFHREKITMILMQHSHRAKECMQLVTKVCMQLIIHK